MAEHLEASTQPRCQHRLDRGRGEPEAARSASSVNMNPRPILSVPLQSPPTVAEVLGRYWRASKPTTAEEELLNCIMTRIPRCRTGRLGGAAFNCTQGNLNWCESQLVPLREWHRRRLLWMTTPFVPGIYYSARCSQSAESAMTCRIVADRGQEIGFRKLRPRFGRHPQFTITDLPQQKIADPHFSASANQQIGIG